MQNGEGAATWAIFLDLDSGEAAAGIKGTEVTWEVAGVRPQGRGGSSLSPGAEGVLRPEPRREKRERKGGGH